MRDPSHLDHPATWSEVCYALAAAFPAASNLGGRSQKDFARQPDFCDRILVRPADLAWMVLACETLAPQWN